jgi:hypothetical protein
MGVSLGFGIIVSGFMVLFVTPAVAVIVDDMRARSGRVQFTASQTDHTG